MQWYLAVLKKYAVFNGRARRKEYWLFVLFNIIISLLMLLLDSVIDKATGGYIQGLFGFLYSLAVLIPSLAVTVRRLHDIGKSGWVILIGLIPVINLWLLALMCTDSNPGQNKYGPNPKEITANIL